jgi:hypothetical protein
MNPTVRRIALLATLALAGCGSADQPVERPAPHKAEALWPKPERFEVDAAWNDAKHALAGTMRLTLRNTGPQALDVVWMRLWPNAFGSCNRPLATLTPTAGATKGPTKEKCTAQELQLENPLASGAKATIAMAFTTTVPAHADRFGRTKDVAYLGTALPQLAVADPNGWRLPPYYDAGESWLTLTSAWKVKLDAPGMTVASTGTETSPGVYEAPKARDFTLVIGHMKVLEDHQGDITVRHFRLPHQPVAQARQALKAAKESLAAFAEWYGPYGRKELDVVQGPAHIATRGIAMEYPEMILTPPSPGAVAHEVAHQWWAFLMGNDPYREPFLDETFAEFSQARLQPQANRLRGCRKPRRPPDPPLSSDVPAFQKAGGRTIVRVVYLGGACTLQRLETALGTERFLAMLRGLVEAHRDATWTRADLIAAIEKAAPQAFDVGEFLEAEGISRPAG